MPSIPITMPGIDFDKLRREITMEQILHLLGFVPTHRSGDQWYGHCPLHEPTQQGRRAFSVNVSLGRYFCHKCRSKGNQLELWANVSDLSLHPAMVELCNQLGKEIPWIHRW